MPSIQNRFTELLAVKRRRDKKSWTYREISAETGINPATLTRFAQQRHEQLDVETLARLCHFLGVEIGEFLYLTPDEADNAEGQRAALAVNGLQPVPGSA